MDNERLMIPLYQQIKAAIVDGLSCAEWKPGEAIPSEVELAQRYAVSQGTVRKAIDELVQAHILIRRQGSGTYVATHAERRVRHKFLKVFTDGILEQGEWFLLRKYLSCDFVVPPPHVRQFLRLDSTAKVYAIKRHLYYLDTVVIQDNIWLKVTSSNSLLTLELLNARQHEPLYGVLEELFYIRLLRAEEHLKAVLLPEAVAIEMAVSRSQPVLQIQRISYSYHDKPQEYRESYCITDNHYYKSQVK